MACATERDIIAWYLSPEAHDVVSRFQTARARKDVQDIIAWIFPPGGERDIEEPGSRHSSGRKEDDRPDEEGQPAIDIIGQARPEFQARNTSADS